LKIRGISIILVLVILAVAIGVSSIYYFMKLYLAKPSTTVPTLVGKSIEKATDIATKYGLYLKVSGKKPSPLYDVDVVISQKPKAGRIVKQGSIVYVCVSLGSKGAMLSLTGKPYQEAVKEIQTHGLSVGDIVKIPSDSFPEGTVIAQYPIYITGEHTKKVDLLVSLGKAKENEAIEEKLPEVFIPSAVKQMTKEAKKTKQAKPKESSKKPKLPLQKATQNTPQKQNKEKPESHTTTGMKKITFSFNTPKKKATYKMTIVRIDKKGSHIELQKQVKGGQHIEVELFVPKGYNVIRILLDGKFYREDRYY